MNRKSKAETIATDGEQPAPAAGQAPDAQVAAAAAPAAPPALAATGDGAQASADAAAENTPPGPAAAFDADGPMPEAGGRWMRMPDGKLQRIEEDD